MHGKFEGSFNVKDYLPLAVVIVLTLVVLFLLTGCSQPEYIEKIVYRDKECPTPKIKPIFKEYEMVILKINDIEYYALQKSEAIKMSTNWVSYQKWAEANYLLIKKDPK